MAADELELLRSQWCTVASELSIACVAPYVLRLPDSTAYEFACLLPQFGGTSGMLIGLRYSQAAAKAATRAGFGYTFMGPEHFYVPVKAHDYIECLRDWVWVAQGAPPPWYKGAT